MSDSTTGAGTAQLVSREWMITDAGGNVETVKVRRMHGVVH